MEKKTFQGELYIEVASKIIDFMLKKPISLSEFIETLPVSPSVVRNILSEKRVHLKSLCKLKKFFDELPKVDNSQG